MIHAFIYRKVQIIQYIFILKSNVDNLIEVYTRIA